jgi:hypothetical protein
VSPIQATLIHHLSDLHINSGEGGDSSTTAVSLSQLSSLCNLSSDETRQWMQYWVSKGVVKETLLGPGESSGEMSSLNGEREIQYAIIENQAERDRNDLEVSLTCRSVMISSLLLDTEQRIIGCSSALHWSLCGGTRVGNSLLS